MKKHLFSLAVLIGSIFNAQTYSNGPLSTGATSTNGTAAPAGYTWSELQLNNIVVGVIGVYTSQINYRLADDFVVTNNEKWTISSVDVFAYQTSSTATALPFDAMNLKIWNGRPGEGTVVSGDGTTNILSSGVDNLTYRIGGPVVQTNRRIWKLTGNISAELNPGTYWIDYQAHATNDGGAFNPLTTIVGSNGPSDGNSLQNTGTQWVQIGDGTPTVAQALPFIINYVATALGTTEARQFDSRVVLYPNPVNETFKLQIPKESLSANTEVSLYDSTGRKVKFFKVADSYNVSDLAKGVYLLKINDGGNIKATKFIKN